MDPAVLEILKVGGGGAFGGALLVILYLVGMRMVRAIDVFTTDMKTATAANADAHADHAAALAAINSKLDERMRARTNPHGHPITDG